MDYDYLYVDLLFKLESILGENEKVDDITYPQFYKEDDYPQCGLFKGSIFLNGDAKYTFEFLVYRRPKLCDSMYDCDPEFAVFVYKVVSYNGKVIFNEDPFTETDKVYESYKQQITEKGVMS